MQQGQLLREEPLVLTCLRLLQRMDTDLTSGFQVKLNSNQIQQLQLISLLMLLSLKHMK